MTALAPAYIGLARKHLADRLGRIRHCVGQLDDEQVWWRPHDAMNSVGNLLLHLGGNLRQWIVAGVGGLADTRDRPAEFAERGPIPREDLIRRLEAAVAEADAALAALDGSRLLEPRRIQGFDKTVLSAIWGSLEHLSGHAQEIVASPGFSWASATASPGRPRRPKRVPRFDRLRSALDPVELRGDLLGRTTARPRRRPYGRGAAEDRDDVSVLHQLLASPYEAGADLARYRDPPLDECGYRTSCGT